MLCAGLVREYGRFGEQCFYLRDCVSHLFGGGEGLQAAAECILCCDCGVLDFCVRDGDFGACVTWEGVLC